MFVKLAGRTCLVVGAGPIGEQKIASLLGTGARIRVVALEDLGGDVFTTIAEINILPTDPLP